MALQDLLDRDDIPEDLRAAIETGIAEAKASEELARDDADRYQALFASMPDAAALNEIIVDGNGDPCDYRFVAVNSAFERMTGLAAETTIGRTVLEVLPDTDEYWVRTFGQVALTGEPVEFEHYGSDLEKHWQGTAHCPKHGQFVVVFKDITEREQAEEELRRHRSHLEELVAQRTAALAESEAQLRAFLANAAIGIAVADPKGRYIEVNDHYLTMFGYPTRDELFRQVVGEVTHPEDREATREAQQQLAAGEIKFLRLEKRYLRKDGSVFWGDLSIAPIVSEDGSINAFVAVISDITESKQAGEALRLSESRYRSLVENLTVGIVVHGPDTEILHTNPKAEALLGLTKDQMRGRTSADPHWRFVREDGRPLPLNEYPVYRALSSKGLAEGQILGICRSHPEGPAWVLCNAYVARDASGQVLETVITLSDITERREAEETLHLTRFAMNRISVPIYWIGPDAQFRDVNDAACQALGYSRDELLSMAIHDINVDYPPDSWPRSWHELRQRGAMTVETRHKRKDGGTFPVEITANYVAFGGDELNVAFAVDLTERRRAEAERSRLEAELQHTQRLESLSVLAGGVAHDFNNLLSGVVGYAELAGGVLPPESPARHYVRQIEKAGSRAADLAKQMLAYSGHGAFVIEPINLSRLVGESTHLLETAVSKKSTIYQDLASCLPPVMGDVTQLGQILLNLVLNASEALEGEAGLITVRTGFMDADGAYLAQTYLTDYKLGPGEYVYLQVSDTGCGMDQETAARVFEPFFLTRFAGRGLGLAATLGIIRGHKGAVHIDTEPSRGTTFTVLFPFVQVEQDAKLAATQEAPGAGAWRGSGTVLVVDDEDLVVDVARAALEPVGLTVLVARDGEEAVSLFRQHGDEIAAVLLDRTMPKMHGEAALRLMRATGSDVPVLVSSGHNELRVVDEFNALGISGFLQKPYKPSELVARIRRLLEDGSPPSKTTEEINE